MLPKFLSIEDTYSARPASTTIFFLDRVPHFMIPLPGVVDYPPFVSLEVRYSILVQRLCIYIIDVRLGSAEGAEQQTKARCIIGRSATAFRDPCGWTVKDVEHSRSNHAVAADQSSLAQPPAHGYTIPRRQDEKVARIMRARRASRKERPRYEVKEDFGYS